MLPQWQSHSRCRLTHLVSTTLPIAMFDTVCAVFLASNVSGFATGNSFCVTNITEANMEPFPRRGMLPKTQLHCPSKPSVGYCVHLDETGGTSHAVVHASKEHAAFFPSCSVVWWTRKKGASFVVLLSDIFQTMSNWPSPLLRLKCLLLVVVYRINIWGAAVRERGFTACRTAPQTKKKTQYMNSRRRHT